MPERNYCSTDVEASRTPCTLSAQRLHQISSRTFCCIIILILKHPHNVCLLSNLFNRNLIKLYRPTTPDMSHTTSSHSQASTLTTMPQRIAASTMLTLCMGNLAMRWREGSTRHYQTTYGQPLRKPSTLSQESLQSNGSTQERSMRSTTLMSAIAMTTKSFRSTKPTSGAQTTKVRIMFLITNRTNVTAILTPTLATNIVLDTRETTIAVEGTSTITRITTMRSQHTFKSPSLGQPTKINCSSSRRS